MPFLLSTGNKILANPIYRYRQYYLFQRCLVEIEFQDPFNPLKYFTLHFFSCLLFWQATFLAFMFPAIYYQYASRAADLLLNFQMNYL